MPDRPYDVVLLDAGGVLVSPNTAVLAEHFVSGGYDVEAGRLVDAHYHGVLAVDRVGAEPEVFDDYHVAFVEHLGFESEHRASAVALLASVWGPVLWDQPLAGAAAALADIEATGLPIVIVSNADGTVEEVLRRSGLVQVGPGPGVEVAAIIDSGAVGVAKPDPRIFELALDVVGVEPHRAVHVGDTVQYDVQGARAAGIDAVLVDHLGVRTDVDGCARVRSLAEVVPLLS